MRTGASRARFAGMEPRHDGTYAGALSGRCALGPSPMAPSPAARSLRHRSSLALLLAAALPLGACGGGDSTAPAPQADPTEALLRRERAAALVSKEDWARARAELAPLLAAAQPAREDLLIASQIELQTMGLPAVKELLARWAALDAEDPALAYVSARVAHLEGDVEQEIRLLEQALERAPGDPASLYSLASALNDRDYATDEEWEAGAARQIELYDQVEALGLSNGTIWYVSTIYRRFLLASDLGEAEDIERYKTLWGALTAQGAKPASESVLSEGTLAQVGPPRPVGTGPSAPPSAPSDWTAGEPLLAEWADAARFEVHDLDGDRRMDLVACGPFGLRVAIQEDDGSFTETSVREDATEGFAAIDLNRDDDWDLLWWTGPEVGLMEHDEGAFAPTPLELPAPGGAVLDVAPVDYDHDGDLDLLLATLGGGMLWRNDGAGVVPEDEALPRGSFTDATAEASLPRGRAFSWACIEDLDSDQDVDLLLGGAEGVWIGSSLRSGRFEEITATFAPGLAATLEPSLADWDADGDVDLFTTDGDRPVLWRQGEGVLRGEPVEGPAGAAAQETDVDLDGFPDLVMPGDGVRCLLAAGHGPRVPTSLAGAGTEVLHARVADLDFSLDPDLRQELVTVSAEGVRIWRTQAPGNKGLRLRWVGKKDNRQAIGAIIELRAGPRYRRVFWKGDLEVLGLGSAEWADVVRVTWPNGVGDSLLGVERGDMTILAEAFGVQPEGLIGSCPFLYTWNGETFEFISDVLGITPLGLPMAPGMLVPPDHDEFVLVRGDQLVPNEDGVLELQFTEELREVTYLDRAYLQAVDHPMGVEVFPNERFSFPPFPEEHLHTVTDALAPLEARGSDGEDWTAALAAEDDVHAVPFEGYMGQYLGLAEPHFLELAFDPERVRTAKRLRLVCTGWFYWTDASVNMAAGRTPGLEFVPPLMMAETPNGEWAPTGPPLGFPAGKTKTMVIDVTETFPREASRIRLFSTLMLYWDRIALAIDDDDAGRRVTDLEPASARLWHRGFSAPVETGRKDLPERFEWERLATMPRWDQHPGRYTRHGECLPLVEAIDDRFVIMGSGDCLTLRFDASSLPALPEGWTRDWMVFLDGWAKDRDPNTVEALEVEPLPFHGMSGYPYGPEESFPADAEHELWRQEWNTRAARRHLAPVAPSAFRDWSEGF